MSAPSIVPIESEQEGPQVGEWVLVWGQVAPGNTHPEDALVEFFSHNEQFRCHVRRDRIEAGGVPAFAQICRSLYRDKKGRFIRCESPLDHHAAHMNGSQIWNDLGQAGWIEVDE